MAELTDAELRKELVALGYRPGPITDTTRKVYVKKLGCLRAEVAAAKRRGRGAPPSPARSAGRGGGLSARAGLRTALDGAGGLSSESSWGTSTGRSGGLSSKPLSSDGSGYLPSRSSWGLSLGRSTGQSSPSLSETAGDRKGLSSYSWWKQESEVAPSTHWGSAAARSGLSHQFGRGEEDLLSSVRRKEDREPKPGGWAGGLARRLPWSSASNAGLASGSRWDASAAGQGITPRTKLLRTNPRQRMEGKGKGLEYYLSKFLFLASFVLLMIFLGILMVKMIGSASLTAALLLPVYSCLLPVSDFQFCQAKHKDIIMNILHELYNYLSIQAGNFECGNPENLKSKCIWVSEARDHVVNITGSSPQKFEAALHWILNSNKDLGIWLRGTDLSEPVTKAEQVVCLESAHPQMGLGCRFRRAVVTAIMNLFLFFWSKLSVFLISFSPCWL
uniref:LEM domain nuclear envelope protein 2 n=1 Tax=Anas platyrhynchos platyrhynchos TaxID=8840 RepID=A0A493TM44_ANAPP